MRFLSLIPTAIVALLVKSAAGFPFRPDLARELRTAAELGIDWDLVLKDRQTFREAVTKVGTPAEYVSLPIDHDDPSVGTFQNRFWVNDEHYAPGGPVFFYDVGEANGEGSAALLTASASFFPDVLQEFNAIGIVWEHRYYGDSLPFPVTNNTPPEHWKYLTTRQALADIPVFAENFTRPSFEKYDLTPELTPWIMVGGSYPGARAAFARKEYPDTIFAAFASSAVVHAQIDMSVYYEQIYRSMVANGLGNCALDIHAALEYIDDQLSQEDTAVAIKQLFFGVGAEKNSNEDFTAALSGIFGYFQSYGLEGPSGSLGPFCRHLESDPVTGLAAGPEGLAPRLGNKYLAERWATWPTFTEVINLNYETNCEGLNKRTATSCELNKPVTRADAIAWTWQYCSEWGFYQSNNEGTHSLLSRYQTQEFQQFMCNRQFPEAVERGLLPPEPQTDAVKAFGDWNARPSNVYFSAGEFDPWRTMTPLSTESFSPQLTVTSDIPQCGVQTAADTVFGYVGANQVHCFDFQVGSELAEVSRDIFRRALREWLPCFEKQK
ncbi:putative serine peptidase, family S28 [Aspergillus mulundensis]|uniref:Serine peptidase, family S28 n=1 Tax=Aspergillus mulundensis TaxID=1810919 RepID=A0A3D8QZY4_9EURO|nr:hypothetical protein DSM5745_09087 [Aspergillus mulundensis]RDW67221.1 hypothetical protein DSM5745_09087 [Aspergillus mulundensis]